MNQKTEIPRYTTDGSVRGRCGHKHRTIRGALACLAKDMRGCASQGGYSDRTVRRLDGEPLTENEADEVQAGP